MRVFAIAVLLLPLAACSRIDRLGSATGSTRVDVGGHKLQVLVEGSDQGRPTVIFESGLGGGIDSWAAVRPSIAEVTRMVSYTRAGNGGSQPGPRPRSSAQIVNELRVMLQKLDIAPPYVLVGHSIGGIYVRAFAGMYPDEVCGLVLLDPTMEFGESLSRSQVDVRLRQFWGSDYPRIEQLLARVHPKMAAIAAQSMLSIEPFLERIPIDQRPTQRDAWLELIADRSQQIEGMLVLFSEGERQELFASMESMHHVRSMPAVDTPVVLLVAGKVGSDESSDGATDDPTKSVDYVNWSKGARMERYSQYIETTPNGKMKVLHDAGHNIPKDRPDAISEAILQLLGVD
jgi:pimeloyl-ACP methyl ester carboxylesterase